MNVGLLHLGQDHPTALRISFRVTGLDTDGVPTVDDVAGVENVGGVVGVGSVDNSVIVSPRLRMAALSLYVRCLPI